MDCSPPGFSVHGNSKNTGVGFHAIFQGIFQLRDRTCISCIFCIAGEFFAVEPPGKPWDQIRQVLIKKLKITHKWFFSESGDFLNSNHPSSQSYGFSSSHVWMWELDYKESRALKNWCFWEKTLESPLDSKEIQPVHPKGNQSWIFIGRTEAEAETPILWPPPVKKWLIGKDPDAGKDWRLKEKGTTEDEMVGWHLWLGGHEFE